MQPESAAYLWDVRSSATLIAEFIAETTSDDYETDDLLKSAVERQLEIIGEALNRLRKADSETASRIPDLGRIIGLRNVLAHGYAVVDDAIVWVAASERVPELSAVVDALLADTPR